MPCAHSKDGTLTVCRPRADHVGPLHVAVLVVDLGDGEPRTLPPIARSERTPARCFKCGARKWAKNLHVVRDAWRGPLIRCADGCRAHKDRRNAAARRRYARRKAHEKGRA